MSSYFIKVKSCETSVNAESEYWSRQVVSATRSNLFFNEGGIGVGVPNPLGLLAVDGSASIGSAYSTETPPTDGLIVSGNVGFGTASPQAPLHVVGDALVSGSAIVNALTLGTATLAAPTGSMPMFACRAWVNFDGTLTTGVWRAGGNIASVVRNSNGVYTITFSTAMSNTNYACFVTFDSSGTSASTSQPIITKTTTAVQVSTYRAESGASTIRTAFSPSDVSVSIFL
jgi:hypothetical protein